MPGPVSAQRLCVEQVAWAITANHGGGYSYRLCPKTRRLGSFHMVPALAFSVEASGPLHKTRRMNSVPSADDVLRVRPTAQATLLRSASSSMC